MPHLRVAHVRARVHQRAGLRLGAFRGHLHLRHGRLPFAHGRDGRHLGAAPRPGRMRHEHERARQRRAVHLDARHEHAAVAQAARDGERLRSSRSQPHGWLLRRRGPLPPGLGVPRPAHAPHHQPGGLQVQHKAARHGLHRHRLGPAPRHQLQHHQGDGAHHGLPRGPPQADHRGRPVAVGRQLVRPGVRHPAQGHVVHDGRRP
mmetsp:Transcript_8809/g.25575  ORF Transcript_8809/g.25575 Transcript_8809/m.25575 type:complete len:204 (+) Transcript_8809:1930-2541(+)